MGNERVESLGGGLASLAWVPTPTSSRDNLDDSDINWNSSLLSPVNQLLSTDFFCLFYYFSRFSYLIRPKRIITLLLFFFSFSFFCFPKGKTKIWIPIYAIGYWHYYNSDCCFGFWVLFNFFEKFKHVLRNSWLLVYV